MTPMAATLSWNNDVILLHHTSRLRVCGPRRPFVLLFLHLIVRQPLRNTQHIGHTRRRYGIRLITKSIWSGLTNSEESGEGGWEREIMRDQRSRLTINWIGGGRMRSLNFFFFHRNGCTEHKGGFHQTHRCTYACALTDNARTENFFFFLGSYITRQLLLWWRKSVIQPKRGIGWRGARERKAGGLCWRGTDRGGTGRGPDTKIIRSMHNNPNKCHLI